MIVYMDGGQVLRLSDENTQVGHLILEAGGLFSRIPGCQVYMHPPQLGERPWLIYVELNSDGTPNFQKITNIALDKSNFLKVSA